MSQVRPLEAADTAELAALFQRVFRDGSRRAPASLEAYLRLHYLEAPGCDPAIGPLVHLDANGSISAFVGINALPMAFGERRLRAAVFGSLMSDPRAKDPMAVPRLLRACLAGPQDFSISETASEVSRHMWTRLGGIALPQYSLDWVRAIRPAGFALELADGRTRLGRFLSPVANLFDRRLRRRIGAKDLRWSAVPDDMAIKGGLQIVATSHEGFAAMAMPLTKHFLVRPDWSADHLAHIAEEAGREREFGEAAFAIVQTPGGKPVGGFAYHGRPGKIARVLQILSEPAQTGAVLDCLIRHASEHGAVALRGRTQPALLEAMLGRRIAFTHLASTVIHSKDEEILDAYRSGRGFANGLAGETWSALLGGRFD